MLDQILKVIKKQKEINDDNLVETLIKKFGLTDIQATFIINLLHIKLVLLHILMHIRKRWLTYLRNRHYTYMITHDEEIIMKLLQELQEFKKYGDQEECKVVKKKILIIFQKVHLM